MLSRKTLLGTNTSQKFILEFLRVHVFTNKNKSYKIKKILVP